MADPQPATPPPAPRAWLTYGDGLRIVACLAVILIHVTSHGVAQFGVISRVDWWTCMVIRAGVTWAVPVFVMLSGALLLDPSKDEPLGRFVTKRLTRVGVPLICWTAAYLAWRVYYKLETPTLPWGLRLVVFGQPWPHLYFLYLLCGLYAVTPVLRHFTRHATPRQQVAMALFALGLGTADKLARSYWDVSITGFLMWVPYLGYYALGWCLRDVRLEARRLAAVWVLFAATVIFTTLLSRALYDLFDGPTGRAYACEFLAPNVVLMAVCAYLMLSHGCARWRGRVVRALSSATLGVYLIHPAVLNVLRDHGLGPTWHGAPVGILVSALVAGGVSLVLTGLLWALPVVRRVVGG